MKKEIEAFVNAANEQELEAAWNNLSAEEQRVFEQLMEEEPPEDALAFFAQLYDDAPKEQTSETVNISENEIYFKRKPLTEEQKKHSSYVDENGNFTDVPPEERKKEAVKLEDIVIAVPKKDDSEPEIQRGRVEHFNEGKGYGFIKDLTSGEKYFFHVSSAPAGISEGNTVTFETERSARGMNAINITLTK